VVRIRGLCGVSDPRQLAWICVCGSVPAGTNLCSYWFGLGTAAVGLFDLYGLVLKN